MTTVDKQIWVEKYRPDSLDEIRGNEKEVDRLQSWVGDPSMPNVLLWGPQGTGKTASVYAFAKDKFGDQWANHVLQLNASDERGIDTVRNKIKNFASRGGVMGEKDFNIVMLDEVDNMTRDAQPAMRRIMEDFHDRTRFFLICNYPNELIDPLQSRCAMLQISPLQQAQMQGLVEDVAEQEELKYDDEHLETIVEQAEGDARAAIHTLQSATEDGKVVDNHLEAVTSIIDVAEIEELLDAAIGEDHEQAMEIVDEMIKQGVDVQALCDEMVERVDDRDDIPADSRALLIDKIADCEWRILHGSNPKTQLKSLVTDLRVARHVSLGPYQEQHGE